MLTKTINCAKCKTLIYKVSSRRGLCIGCLEDELVTAEKKIKALREKLKDAKEKHHRFVCGSL